MIVKCISDRLGDVSKDCLVLGPDLLSDPRLALSIGKRYIVYAARRDNDAGGRWYLVFTDRGYLWWMPATSFEVTESDRPRGWTDAITLGNDTVSAHPSLHQWRIEEGIIDREREAQQIFLSEVGEDPTFPSDAHLGELNGEFERRQSIRLHNAADKMARTNGWERPERLEDDKM